MPFNLSNVKKITLPVGSTTKDAKAISLSSGASETTIWKGTWLYTINIGDYVSSVKYSDDNTNWTTITSNTTVEIDSGKTLYIQAESYAITTAQYTYTPSNFNITRTEANEGGSVTVSQTRTLNSYTITWKNHDGTTLKTDTVNYGDTPSYTGSTPTKSQDNIYTYSFSGWSPSVSTVTGNATYTAQYSSSYRNYTTHVKAGDYVSTVRAKVGSSGSWTSASSSVLITHHYNDKIYWEAVDYSTDDMDNTTVYTYSGSTSGNFVAGTGTTYTVNRTLTTSVRYYTAIIYAGTYVSKVRIRVSGGSFGDAGSYATVKTTYGQTIIWEATEYTGDNNTYYYTGDTSGRVTTYGSWSFTANRTQNVQTYTTTINAGDYVSSLKVKVGSGSWSSASSSVSVTHTYNQTIYWELVSYNTDYSDNTTNYSFSGSTSGNFASGTGSTQTINRSRSTSTRYYTTTVYAGDYVSTVKAGTSTAYSSGTGSSVSVTHQYNETIYWALVSYDTDYSDNTTNYSFSGSTSGSFSGGSGTTYTANRSRSTSTRYYTSWVYPGDYVSEVAISLNGSNWIDGDSGSGVSIQHTYGQTIYWRVNYHSQDYTSGFYTYTYSGSSSGSFNGGSGTSYTVNWTRTSTHRDPLASDFNITVYNDDDGEDDYYHGLAITNNFDNQLSLSVSLRYNYTVVYFMSSRTVNGNGGTYSEGSWGYGGSMSCNRAVINWTWGSKSGTITKDF